MADQFLQGIGLAGDFSPQVMNEIMVAAINWYANRCPLVTRLPRLPIGSAVFTMVNRTYRTRTLVCLGTHTNSVTTLNVDDISPAIVGDVYENLLLERFEVTAVNVGANTATILRACEGTTHQSMGEDEVLTLIGNRRTGGEVNQDGTTFAPVAVTQYVQTWQHPTQVSGLLQASTQFQTQSGVSTPFQQVQMDALQNLMDDMETSTYYGKGEDPATSGNKRASQKGLRKLIVTNLVTAPVSGGAYKPSDLIRDTLQNSRKGGGEPDVLVVSTDWMSGFATWGHAVQRIDAGTSIFGNAFKVFACPFLGDITLIEAPLLKSGTAIALTSAEVRMRMMRNEFWNPRGNRGDALEGEYIASGALELENEPHHAWLEGVTGFSAT